MSVAEHAAESTSSPGPLPAGSESLTGASPQAGRSAGADAQPVIAASSEQNTQRRTVRLSDGPGPVGNMPCRAVCFMTAPDASHAIRTADGHPSHAALQCCVLPSGPSLASLRQVQCLPRQSCAH